MSEAGSNHRRFLCPILSTLLKTLLLQAPLLSAHGDRDILIILELQLILRSDPTHEMGKSIARAVHFSISYHISFFMIRETQCLYPRVSASH